MDREPSWALNGAYPSGTDRGLLEGSTSYGLSGLPWCWGLFLGSPVLHLKHKTIENFQIRGFGS